MKPIIPLEAAEIGELDVLEEFTAAVAYKDQGQTIQPAQMLHCNSCGDLRRVRLFLGHKPDGSTANPPILTFAKCVQCDTLVTMLVYQGPNGSRLAVLSSTNGGLTTPHTPEGVAYYLDQAQKSHSIGANSASVAMFRGALEHLLFDQGFKDGMCGKKLNDLEAGITAKTAPKWAYELDTDFLKVMKQLGDSSIHPNDGDVKKQEVMDSSLIIKLRHTFQELLFLIYELPHKKAERLKALRAGVIKK
jgi:hypothetical protein